jgi:uncharacterized membrane protein YgcG
VCVGLAIGAMAQDSIAVPRKPVKYVTDRPNVIGPKTQAALETKLEAFGKETGNQVVVWIGSTLPAGVTIEEYANASFNLWGLGQKEKNNGVLLMLFVKSRKMRIETGDGVRDRLTDVRAAQILAAMREPLRANEYNRALTEATDAILLALKPPPLPPPTPMAQPVRAPAKQPRPLPELSGRDLIPLITSCALGSLCVGAVLLFLFKALRAMGSGLARGLASGGGGGTTYASNGVTVTHNHYRRGWGWGSRWGSSPTRTITTPTVVHHVVDRDVRSSISSSDDGGSSGSSTPSFSGGGSSSGGGASDSW